MKQIQRPRGKSAFTLTELLVVMGIIGILAVLLLTAIRQAKNRALKIQCVNNLHQIGVGLHVFLADNHFYPLGVAPTNCDIPGRWWAGQLERGGFGISKPDAHFFENGVWRCPSAKLPTEIAQFMPGHSPSYGYNVFGVIKVENPTNALGLFGHHVASSDVMIPIAESEVSNPSDMMAIGDSLFGNFIYFMRHDEDKDHIINWKASARHQGKANVVFCDGHVESPTLQFLFADTSDASLSRWNRDHLPHREKLSP